MATYLDRTFTAGNRQKMTFSGWIRMTHNTATYNHLITSSPNPGQWDSIRIENNRKLGVHLNGDATQIQTNEVLKDITGWYHLHVVIDTTQATDTERIRMYINGDRKTGVVASGSWIAQNFDLNFNNNGKTCRLFDNTWSTGNEYYAGNVSHWHWCDGYAYEPTKFGQVDSTTGEWTINNAPSGCSYGTNGFWLFKNDGSINDDSGQGNNFSSSGAGMSNVLDNPSNVFCRVSPDIRRFNAGNKMTLSNAGNTIANSGNDWRMCTATMGAMTGKFYWEYKIVSAGTGNGYHKVGFMCGNKYTDISNNSHPAEGALNGSYAIYVNNGAVEIRTDDAVISGFANADLGNTTFANGDVVCMALDMDNKCFYFGKNGTWLKSGDPTSGASKTGACDVSSDYTDDTLIAVPNCGIYYPGSGNFNFGDGIFGTTAVSSAGTNASGIGVFEYDVPTGYTALCTKGLNN